MFRYDLGIFNYFGNEYTQIVFNRHWVPPHACPLFLLPVNDKWLNKSSAAVSLNGKYKEQVKIPA